MYEQVGLHVRFLFYCEVLYSSVSSVPIRSTQRRCSFHKVCVPQVCIVYLSAQKKCLRSCMEKYFCFAGEFFSVCSRSCSGGYLHPPSFPLLRGEFAEAYSHVHFGARCIRLLLICLLARKLPPSPTGKR